MTKQPVTSYFQAIDTSSRPSLLVLVLALALVLALGTSRSNAAVQFSRDVLPALSDACFQCHGPDANTRKGKLRLDDETDVKRDRGGSPVVIPGQSAQSEIMRRLLSADPDEVMPPPELKRTLTTRQIENIRQWIDDGAKWGGHWSLDRVSRPEVPANSPHPIDAFINRKLDEEKLTPQPRADRITLIRRLSLDLTGLPPTPEAVDAFVNDPRPNAWASLVDTTLASPRYGERMTWDWLDAARYADSNGYQGDSERTMWPWRDWVINAFNENLPWDRFTVWQLAGDLLPDATHEQILATGFNRNHMINGEGGRIAEENRIDYVMDMLETTGTIWLGQTFNCCRCHDHKFDSLTQKDYYSFFAFFDQTPVTGQGRSAQTAPILATPSEQQQIDAARLAADLRSFSDQMRKRASEIASTQAAWEKKKLSEIEAGDWTTLHPHNAFADRQLFNIQKDGSLVARGPIPDNDSYTVEVTNKTERLTGLLLEALNSPSLPKGGLSRLEGGNFVLTDLEISIRRKGAADSEEIAIADAEATFEQSGLKIKGVFDKDPKTGWGVWNGKKVDGEHAAVFRFAKPIKQAKDAVLTFRLKHDHSAKQHTLGHFRLSVTADSKPTLATGGLELLFALRTPSKERSKTQAATVGKAFRASDKTYAKLQAGYDRTKKSSDNLKKAVPKVMVMADMEKPRKSFMLSRGLYNQPGAEVTAAVPAALPDLPAGAAVNRLALANWLVARDNPLTARVTVNRFWQMFFGHGIVKTSENFGVQGEFPIHPELLDWLSAEFMESGWDVKALIKLIVTSEAYQRGSRVTPELFERDPENRLLARGARFRMPSWMIRDHALAVSGLLVAKIGGAPVNGYQPAGVWEETTFGKKKYKQDSGEKLHRRSLYTFWRRIIAPTLFFDSASRQTCTVKGQRTNTPLHALSTFNDVTYAEAARALAQRVIHETGAGATDADRIKHACRLVLADAPADAELAIWKRGLERARQTFAKDANAVAEFLAVGESALDESIDAVEHAALAVLCLTLLNSDEALTKE
ncbi:MAG: PSD1 and planctomycete cytochrome C domain-containing protein [Verrucomicrobiia bacterium]